MSLSGSVEDLPLLEILQVVAFCQKTGFLVVKAPEGDAGVVFREGRVVSGYIWDVPSAPPGAAGDEAAVQRRLGTILERLVRLGEGEFAFNLAEQVPTSMGGRDLSGDTLSYGINPEGLMLELARKLDEDRRDCTASLSASFAEPQPQSADPQGSARPDRPGPEGIEAGGSGATWPAGPEPVEPGGTPEVDAVGAVPATTLLDAEGAGLEELDIDEPATVQSVPAESAAGGPIVLLVDDELEVCEMVGTRLVQAGFDVRGCTGATEARRAMQRLSSARTAFLLVVDLGLPSESGSSFRAGLDVVRIATALPDPPPVLLMSEAIDEKLMGRARRLGVSLLAFKPGLSKLDPLQYQADLRAFGDKLARDLLPRLADRRGRGRGAAPAAPPASPAAESRDRTLLEAIREIETHPDPDLVAFLLLRAARACFVRALLFVVKEDRLNGLAGFGPVVGGRSLDLLARELAVSIDPPSPLRDVAGSGRTWCGVLPDDDGPLAALVDAIGRLHAHDAAIVPLRVAGQTLAVVYADSPDGTTMASVDAFAAFTERAGHALDGALAARAQAS